MAQGISASGHIVDIINMNLEEGKIISFYDYIVVISEGESFFGKNSSNITSSFFSKCGNVTGKKCACCIVKGVLRKQRVLNHLMKVLESEGVFLKISYVLSNPQKAFALGKRLNIQ